MKRNLAKRSNEQRLLRPRLEVKEEEGFDRSDVKKALLESLYEQRKEERRKELAKELKRRENYSRNRLTEKDQKRSKSNEHRNNSEDKKQNENSKLKRKKEKRGVEQHTSKDKNLLKGKEKVKIQENLVIKNKDAVVVLKSKEKIKVSKERIADQEEKLNEVIPEEAKTVVEKVVHKKVFDIEALPSTTDFVRFMSLDYSDDLEGIPKELQHFRTLPLVPVPELPWSISSK